VSSPEARLSSANEQETTVNVAGPGTAHIILEVTDHGKGFPSTRYRRVVLSAPPRAGEGSQPK
jgi:hypothetical protein